MDEEAKPLKKGTQALTLNYESLTSETEETVTGIINELKDSEEEYYVQIQSDSGSYNGSKIKLKGGKNSGRCGDAFRASRSRTEAFGIYLLIKCESSVYRSDQKASF
jgi:hypothetical protein